MEFRLNTSIYRLILSALLCISLFTRSVLGLSCYRCVSTEPGCGKELNIRLSRWHSCQGTGSGGGENFCVKVIQKVGSEEIITRECLMTLRKDTRHRQKLPTVQRHNYCSPARRNDAFERLDEDTTYCFCNDFNGCNSAPGIYTGRSLVGLMAAVATAMIIRWNL